MPETGSSPAGIGARARTPVPATRAGAPERVLSTLNEDGSRRWLCPSLSRGRFLRARRLTAWFLILLFAALPLVRVNGRPYVLLDVVARRFTILGKTFLPTDTLLLALLLVGVFLTVFILTALFGRVWCGWACPQTVYMEFVYRPIERFFDRRWGGGGRMVKYGVYLLVSLMLAHIFLSYFVGVDRLVEWMRRSPFEHPSSFLLVAAVTGLMMFDFCYFREQTCIVACPYGRFQSVMLDRSSLIVSYDRARGEPRGKLRRAGGDLALPVAEVRTGDCIDCRMCVSTCPTGIDIRDGLQMECIGCAQCIDACDAVMTKIGRPTGLVRYSSQHAMAGEKSRILRPRLGVYLGILAVIGGVFGVVLATQAPANVTALRGLGAPFTVLASGEVGNQLRLKVVNRADAPRTYIFGVQDPPGVHITAEEDPFIVAAGASRTVPAMVVAPADAFRRGSLNIHIRVSDGQGFAASVLYRLLGPGSASRPHAEHEEHEKQEGSHQ